MNDFETILFWVTALLLAGETPQNPPLARAIDFLAKAEMNGTYATAVRAHVWALLPSEFLPLLRRDAKWLLEAHDGRSRFRYYPKPTSFDHSATQYALLSSLMGVPRVIASAPTGFLAKNMGWESFFIACTLIAAPGMLLLLKIAPWNPKRIEIVI